MSREHTPASARSDAPSGDAARGRAPEGPVIEAHGLVKRYGSRAAVDGLDLRVEAGEVFGFLGPNGAGKTTTVRMLLGLARPSGGDGRVLGRPLGDPEARRGIGYLPENVHFPGWFTGLGFLRYHGALYGLPRKVVARRAGEALERLGLAGRGEDRLRAYSHGMLQRLGLAQTLLARPRLVFLDEPTSALDPRGRREVRELLDELRREGTTVFLNSHLLSEVERTCDRVAIVADGQTRYLGPTHPDEDSPRELSVRISAAPDDVEAVLRGVAWVTQRGTKRVTQRAPRRDGTSEPDRTEPERGEPDRTEPERGEPERGEPEDLRLELTGDGTASEAAAEVARRLLDAGARLHELTPVRRELEDLFLELTGAPATGSPGGEARGDGSDSGSGDGSGDAPAAPREAASAADGEAGGRPHDDAPSDRTVGSRP